MTRTIIILLVFLLGINIPGPHQPIVSADTGPDLIVQDITISPASPVINDTVTITVTIKNQGSAIAGISYVTCYLDDTILATESISSLNTGLMATASFVWQATQGTHIIRAVADASGIITETDETNNAKTYTFTTVAPDLTIESITWSPDNPSGGDSININIVIKNQGNAKSRNTNVHFYIDGNTRGTKDITSIEPGATQTKTYTWIVLAGQHTLRAVVDEADNNKESDETNNELTVTFETGAIDLAFQKVAWAPQNPSLQDTVTCNVTVINYGQSRAESWYLAYFIDGTLKSTILGSALEADATENITFSWETLQNEHELRIVLDYYNNVAESDESNNEYTVSITTLLPDLIVSSISWLPANPGTGDNVTFTFKIKNQGSGTAASSHAAIYVDNRFTLQLDIEELETGAEATATFSWLATSGTHVVKIIADYDKKLDEVNNDNNDTSVGVTIAPPDLIINSISWSPENPAIDETVTFTANITNQGGGKAENFHIAFFMDDVLVTSKLIVRLNAGASTNATCNWKVTNGYHTLKAIVNYNNYIAESDKTNNENSIIFAPKLPDLAITSIKWSPPDMPVGSNIIFDINIENLGLISAIPSRIAFYVDGAVAGYVDIGQLEPGDATLAQFIWASSEGFHSINIVLDSADEIAEIDEANNTRVINIPLPDLIVQDITVSPSETEIGETVTISTTIENQGSSKTENSQINCYVDDIKIESQELFPIDIGNSTTLTFNWTAEAGIHTIKITVDIYNTVIEFNETNNEKETNYATATPDLIVEGMSWATSDQLDSNEATFTITIKNIGTGTAQEPQIRYSFDSSPADYESLESLPAGESASFSFITILSTGQHTARITADYDDVIEELDEDNNESIISFSTLSPDLVIRTISYSPLDAGPGDTVTIIVKLENRGNSQATNVRLALSIDGSIVDYADIAEMEIATPITINFSWTALDGEHEIAVFADSEQTTIESNEANNTKSRTVSFTAKQAAPTQSAGIPSTFSDDGGIIEQYWWLLLLLAALLGISAFISTFRVLKKK